MSTSVQNLAPPTSTPSSHTTLERRYQLLVETIRDYAIFMLTPEGIIDSWNAGAQQFKGYAADEIIGQHFRRFYSSGDQANGIPEKALETAAKVGKFEAEGWRVRKDGTCFWAHVVIDAVRDESGTLVGFAKITRDITEKHCAEEKLEAARAALAQSQKMEAIGNLTGGLAHDFNNLLAGIMSNLELTLLRLTLGQIEELERPIRSAIAATKKAGTLTQRLLAFARRQTLSPGWVDARALIQSMDELFAGTVGPEIECTLRLRYDIWPVLCDGNQLESALLNLVINARDAISDIGSIEIGAENVVRSPSMARPSGGLAAGDYVRIWVKDSGSGMTDETIAKAFEPFFTTKPVGQGTGLGLSMVHGFAAQSGGQATIASMLGRGTTVSLYLPRHLGQQEHDEEAAHASSSRVKEGPQVLLVEDEQDLRQILCEMLQHFGYRPIAAANAEECLAKLREEVGVQLLVTDIRLPGTMNGRELAKAARALYSNLPILFITGYASRSDEENKFSPQEANILLKPFSIDTFVAKVHSLISASA